MSGVDPNELVDSLRVARAISAFFTGNRVYANLPRKFKISVTGCTQDCARAEINDVGLWPARLGDEVGFNVLAAAGSPTASGWRRTSTCSSSPDDAVELCRAIAQLYGELGNREHRGIARMRYLVQELGPDAFRRRARHPARRRGALGGDAAHDRRIRRDHVGVHPAASRTGPATWAPSCPSGA